MKSTYTSQRIELVDMQIPSSLLVQSPENLLWSTCEPLLEKTKNADLTTGDLYVSPYKRQSNKENE